MEQYLRQKPIFPDSLMGTRTQEESRSIVAARDRGKDLFKKGKENADKVRNAVSKRTEKSETLQSAMEKGGVAIVEEMLQQRDVNEMKRVQGLAAAFEAGGDKREQLLQQVRSLGFFSRAIFF